MDLRLAKPSDEDRLVQIYESYYSSDFPLDFSKSFAHVVAENGKILGFGWLDLIVEANVILDQETSPRYKFEALKKIISHGESVSKKQGFSQMHVFPKDNKFSTILKKHLQFTDITGSCLVKSLNNGEE